MRRTDPITMYYTMKHSGVFKCKTVEEQILDRINEQQEQEPPVDPREEKRWREMLLQKSRGSSQGVDDE